jgi:hypothetical protein
MLPQPPALVQQGPFISVQVNTTPDGMDILGDAANEPSIAIDPTNPSNIAIGWRQFDTIESSFREAGYSYSRDGGKTWAGALEHTPGVFGSDPVLRAGPDGELYYLSLRQVPALYCDLFVSHDFGATWQGPIFAEGGDKAWLAVDFTDGPSRGALYQHYTHDFTRSFDLGQTWSDPGGFPPTWGQIAVAPDGEVYIAGRGETHTQVARVQHAADPAQTPQIVSIGTTPIPKPLLRHHTINPEGLVGQVNIAFDASGGPYHGRMYVLQTANGIIEGASPQTVLVYSDDYAGPGKATFSDPVFISDDPSLSTEWFGTLAVAPNGRLDVVWFDQRDSPPSSPFRDTRLYASYSTDGGQTWAPNFPVSPIFDRRLGYPVQRKLGDYLDAHSDNLGVSLAYAATFNGGQDIYFLRIGETDCNADGVPDQMQTAAGLAPDCDADGIPDACQARAGEAPPCYCPADLAFPFGSLDFDDVLAFLIAFGAGAPGADLAPPFDAVNFDDALAFLTSFTSGCP